MKNSIKYLVIATVLISSCSVLDKLNSGQDYRSIVAIIPGQVFVPAGAYELGSGKDPNVFEQFSQGKVISVGAFFIDANEVTNDEYRQFVNWVRDSIAITNFVVNKEEFLVKTKLDLALNNEPRLINWAAADMNRLLWTKPARKKNPRLDEMFYKQNHLFNRKGDLDTRILKYAYTTFDYNEAFKNRDNLAKSINDYTFRDTVSVYPDTTVWVKDFDNPTNDMLLKEYFSNPKFGKYPVVGVTWKQAKAFTVWKTQIVNRRLISAKIKPVQVRLPSEAEWEYAARGGQKGMNYPWGNELNSLKGCLMANYKVAPGNYVADGGLFTKPAKSYLPNNYGIYNMSGNVAEWTENYYTASPQGIVGNLNPILLGLEANNNLQDVEKRVVKGGSWRDAPYFIRNASRTFEHQDIPRSYIGFRTVMTASLEQSIKK